MMKKRNTKRFNALSSKPRGRALFGGSSCGELSGKGEGRSGGNEGGAAGEGRKDAGIDVLDAVTWNIRSGVKKERECQCMVRMRRRMR